MWQTTNGVRALRGAEARFVMSAAASLSDELATVKEWSQADFGIELGVPMFDPLTAKQKIMLINYVTFHLLDPKSAPPELTALLEATVAAIYQQAVVEVDIELDHCAINEGKFAEEDEHDDDEEGEWNGGVSDVEFVLYGDRYSNRRLIVEAYMEVPEAAELEMDIDIEFPDSEFCPPIQSSDRDEWIDVIMSLRERVLPDEDWAMESLIADLSPEHSGEMKRVLGISDDYFIAIPKDPTPEQVEKARQDILKRYNDCEPKIDF